MGMFDSIIFDMDGTLVNLVKEIKEAWNESCVNHGWDKVFSSEDIKSIMGLRPREMAMMMFPNVDIDEGTKRIETCTYEEIAYLKTHPGLTYVKNKKFLEQLSRKHKLFIVSNCLEGYIETFLENHHFEKYFIATRNAGNGKNKADNIKDIVNEYKLKTPLYVGDTILDFKSAMEAGVSFCHASYGFGVVDCNMKINDIEELLSL